MKLIILVIALLSVTFCHSQTKSDSGGSSLSYRIVSAKVIQRAPDGNLYIDSGGIDVNKFDPYPGKISFRGSEIIMYTDVMRVYKVIDISDITDSLNVKGGYVYKGHLNDPLNNDESVVFYIATFYEDTDNAFGLFIIKRETASVFFKFVKL